jgi:hypothetical protein
MENGDLEGVGAEPWELVAAGDPVDGCADFDRRKPGPNCSITVFADCHSI